MAQQTSRQRRTAGRVMHEFKYGELKRSQGGKGGKVKSRKQAIAIALKESGASKYESKSANARKTDAKEAKGQTAQQEREGKAKVGASGRRESTRAMGGRNAATTTRRRRSDGLTRRELYAKAQRKHIAGRSRMNKEELKKALGM
jgi:hypothetical protein